MAAPVNPAHLDCTTRSTTQPSRPLLLLLPRSCSDDHRLIFVDLLSNKRFQFRSTSPVGRQWSCRGSSHGWLVFLDESPKVVVLNPLITGAGAMLNLAPLSALPQVTSFHPYAERHNYVLDPEFVGPWEYCDFKVMRDSVISKIVLSDSPNLNPNFTALAIFHQSFRGSNLAFCKYGEDRWTLVPDAFVADAVFIQGRVYAVNSGGGIMICDVSRNPPRVVQRTEITGSDGDLRYLVPLPNSNRFMLVTRSFDLDAYGNGVYKTTEFKVYRLNVSERKWERNTSLEKLALFVGGNSCASAVTVSDFPGCRGNSIHFTDDDGQAVFSQGHPEEHDVGVFCLNAGVPHNLSCDGNARVSRPNPTWLIS